jgi:hypothetical protein
VHCSRVFRSSVPSDLLPSSPCGRPSGTARANAAALDQWNGGSAPVAECRTEGAVRQGNRPARHIPEGTLPGPVRSQGRVVRCVIQNWSHVLSAPRRAWNLHGNNGARCMDWAVAPGQPVVSFVGYSLKAPWGEPVGPVAVRPASAGQADRISAGRHRRIPEFGAYGRASTFRPRPPVSGSGPGSGRLNLG